MNDKSGCGLYAVLGTVAIGLGSCGVSFCAGERPTPQESVYVLDINNKYHWDGKGPGRVWWKPWQEIEKVSHKQQLVKFPLEEKVEVAEDDEKKEKKVPTEAEKLALETKQSIITADGQIMIQEGIVAYDLKSDEASVRRFYVEHREEHRHLLEENLVGLMRTYLQTKTRDDIDKNQGLLGKEIKEYIAGFRVGGTPLYKEGKLVGINGGYTLEEEWGIEVTEVSLTRVRPPSKVLQSEPEAESIVKKAQGEYESAVNNASRRRKELDAIKTTIEEIGDNNGVSEFLSNQATYEMIQNLGSVNIGKLRVIANTGSDGNSLEKLTKEQVLSP